MASFKNPDFTSMNLKEAPERSPEEWRKLFEDAAGANFDKLTGKTMEHIPIKPLYNYDEYEHMNHLDFLSLHPRRAAHHVSWSFLDHAHVCRLLHC